ncbi:MAG: hypothetical protein ACO318_00420 [Pontimonas sp.]
MMRTPVDLDALPLRFNPPDGWRTPHPRWISLYQGFQPDPGWKPYADAPPIPEGWPWWEENGTSWYSFFRSLAPLPARALGNWFSLSALGLFSIVVSPFALQGFTIALGGLMGVVLLIVGIRGVIRTIKRQSAMPDDPLDAIRDWAAGRRNDYFIESYRESRAIDPDELTLDEFVQGQITLWWGGNPEDATS